MNRFKHAFVSSVVVAVALVAFTSRPEAAKPGGGGGTYSCKGDKKLDVPMQFSATLESAGRVHLSASGGSDAGKYVQPYIVGAWRVFNSSGAEVDSFTDSLLFNSLDMLKEAYLEGLLPGSYVVQLTSMDVCGNLGYAKRTVTVPAAVAETNRPVVSVPTIVQQGAMGAYGYALYFTATDDTAIKHVTVYVAGSPIADYDYSAGASFRWWTAFYPQDNVLYPFEGPSFFPAYATSFIGQCGVQVVAEDVFGNQTTASAPGLCLP